MNPIRDERTIRALELLNEEIAGLNAALESERLARIAAEKERDAAKEKAEAFDWLEKSNPEVSWTLVQQDGHYLTWTVKPLWRAAITRRSLFEAVKSAMAVAS